jgi:hypothetical protein
MTPEEIKQRRLQLEEQDFAIRTEMGRICRECKHEQIEKGSLKYSYREGKVVQTYRPYPLQSWERWESVLMFCQICDKEFGWFCPKNPKGYCEYDNHGYACIHCHISDERK